jgi:hypothetical protein
MKINTLFIFLALITGIYITNCSGDDITINEQFEIESVLKKYYQDSKKSGTDYNKNYELICEEDRYILNKNALVEKWARDLYYIEFISIN